MRLNSRFLWLSRCLFNSKFKLVCQERPEKSGRIFTLDRPTFIAILADPGTWFPVHHVLCPNSGLALSIFLLSQKFLSIVPSSVPVSLGIRFSACSIYDSTNSMIQWHLWYKTQYVPLWKIWKFENWGDCIPVIIPSIHSTWILSWPFPGYCLQLFSGRFLVCSCVDRF